MQTLTLAYRDVDRTPVIFAIREMAKKHYDLDVRVVQIKNEEAYEAALFHGSCDVVIEHLEYLYSEAVKGRKVTIFCAPSKGGGLHLVVPQNISGVQEFKGKTIWGQWKKVVSGENVATFMSPLYLPEALAAGLKVLPVPDIPIVGHFAQACLSEFARKHAGVLRDYVKAVLRTLAWLTTRRDEAFAALASDLKDCMKLENDSELKGRFDSVVNGLKTKPYPTPEAIANTYEIATLEYPGAKGLNPLSLWDLHWVKELDDQGSIDDLVR